jgi:predicted  nucleic acid-binding Zn-ribbon protein
MDNSDPSDRLLTDEEIQTKSQIQIIQLELAKLNFTRDGLIADIDQTLSSSESKISYNPKEFVDLQLEYEKLVSRTQSIFQGRYELEFEVQTLTNAIQAQRIEAQRKSMTRDNDMAKKRGETPPHNKEMFQALKEEIDQLQKKLFEWT